MTTLTDLEIVRLCAEAMGLTSWQSGEGRYDPLHDDAQAMELMKRLGLSISGPPPRWTLGRLH